DSGGASVATPTNDDDLPKAADEVRKFIDRAQRGDETTLPVLRKLLDQDRYVDAFGGNLALQTERTLIEAAAGPAPVGASAIPRGCPVFAAPALPLPCPSVWKITNGNQPRPAAASSPAPAGAAFDAAKGDVKAIFRGTKPVQ